VPKQSSSCQCLANLVMYCFAAGTLTATITCPRGNLIDFDLLPYNTDADNNADMFVLKFLPRIQGTDARFARKRLSPACFFTFFLLNLLAINCCEVF